MLTGNKNVDLLILSELEDKDLVSVCKTNKQANKLCNDQGFWLNRIIKKFPYLDLSLLRRYKGDRDWSQYYIEDLRTINKDNANNKLINASSQGRFDQVMIAVKNGADVIRNDIAISPIISASKYGHLNIVKYLVKQGSDVRQNSDYSLLWASINGHLDTVKYLVKQGADVTSRNSDAVKYASRNGHLDVVKYLTEQGADIRTDNDYAIRWALDKGLDDVVDYLISQGVPDLR